MYVLIDPQTDEWRYVGVTSQPIRARLSQHCTRLDESRNRRLVQWLKALLPDRRPIVRALSWAPNKSEAEEDERAYIGATPGLFNRLFSQSANSNRETVAQRERREKAKQWWVYQ